MIAPRGRLSSPTVRPSAIERFPRRQRRCAACAPRKNGCRASTFTTTPARSCSTGSPSWRNTTRRASSGASWTDTPRRWRASWVVRCLLIEYGSGNSSKTRLLLDQLREPAGYVPVDVSGQHLRRSARALASGLPGRRGCSPSAAISRAPWSPAFFRPAASRAARARRLVPRLDDRQHFTPDEAVDLLRRTRRGFVVGAVLCCRRFDLRKDPQVIGVRPTTMARA